MSTKMMIKLLDRGATGNEILEILDTLTQEESQGNSPTLEEIEF